MGKIGANWDKLGQIGRTWGKLEANWMAAVIPAIPVALAIGAQFFITLPIILHIKELNDI